MKRRVKDFLLGLKLTTRMIVSFTVISLFPIILVGLTTYYFSAQDIYRMSKEYATGNTEVVYREIDALFEEAGNICDSLSQNPNIQEHIRRSFSSISEQYSWDLKGSMELLTLYSNNRNIYGIYVLGENGGEYKSNQFSFKNADFRSAKWYREILDGEGMIWFGPHTGSFAAMAEEKEFISVGKPIIDKATGIAGGVVLVEIEADRIGRLLDSYQSSNCGFYLMDGSHEVMLKSSFYPAGISEDFMRMEQEGFPGTEGSVHIGEESYLVGGKGFSNMGWKLYSLINSSDIGRNLDNIAVICLCVMVISFIILINVVMWNADAITKPIREMERSMKEVEEGDLNARLSVAGRDEISRLCRNFNMMMDRIRELTDTIYREQDSLRRAEMKALQSQINPHFLYNSLDSISWLLRLDRTEDAIRMLNALTKLFKVALSKGREFIPIRDEICHAENYLLIQKIRYNKKFDYEIQVEESVYRYRTIKLILQPLIENAIYHGISGETEEETIRITVREEGDHICFQVEDTGNGMDVDTLARLRSAAQNDGEDDNSGYGMRNIRERLDVCYMGRASMEIDSSPGEGCTVRIRIPVKVDKTDEMDEMDEKLY